MEYPQKVFKTCCEKAVEGLCECALLFCMSEFIFDDTVWLSEVFVDCTVTYFLLTLNHVRYNVRFYY